MHRSIPRAHGNFRVFYACLLSFMTLMAPLASVAAASPNYRSTAAKTTAAPSATTTSKTSPVEKTVESLDAQEASLFLPAAPSVPAASSSANSLFASATAEVTAVSLFLPAAGDVTATMTDASAGADDANSDGNVDPGDKIAYTATLSNPSGGASATGLSFNVPIDSHTTLDGPVQSTPVTFDKVVPAFNEDATAQAIVLQGQDPDGSNLTFVIVGSPTKGTLGNLANLTTPTCAPDGICSASITYTPTANEFGSDSFTFSVNDGTSNSNEVGTVSITINSVNDAPSFTAPGNPPAVNEDVAGQTVTPFVTDISKGPSPSEDGQAVDFVIDSNSHTALFAVQPAISPTGTLTYTPAANANGTALITYHLHDDGGTANGGVNVSSPNQTFTITVNAVNDAPVAQPKAFTVETNMKISGLTGLLTGVTDPDATNGAADPLSFDAAAPAYTTPSVTLANITVNTCQAAGPPATTSTVTITNASTGTFNFDPSPGMTGTCVLKYQVTDTGKGSGGNQTSAQADITITHTGPVIWFVDPNRATDGNGTLSDTSLAAGQPGPFNKLSSANAKLLSLAANQRVFVYTGSTPIGATEVLLLQSGATPAAAHWLIGQGVKATDFDTLFGINGTVPMGTIDRPTINGTRPTIRGTVNMRSNTRVEGVNINVSGAAAGSKGLTNNGVALTAGSVLTIKDVSVTSAAGNAVDFSSAQTMSFTTSDAATSPNILVSTTGIALNIVNTTIGAGNLNFRSISSNGASSGIVLNNTGATGSLIVSGNSGACTSAATCTGGAIQNSTSHGVSLTTTLSPSFTRLAIQNTSGSGVRGTDVTNFTFQNGFIDNSGTGLAAQTSNIAFNTLNANNVDGVVSIINNTLTNAYFHGVTIENDSGTITSLDISNNTLTSSTAGGPAVACPASAPARNPTTCSQGNGIHVIVRGTVGVTSNLNDATVTNNIISNFPLGGGIIMQGSNATAGSPQLTFGIPNDVNNIISITGNRIAGASPTNRINTNAIQVSINGIARGNWEINNNGTVANPITNIAGNVISTSVLGTSTGTVKINNNRIVANHTPNFGAPFGISAGVGRTFACCTDVATLTIVIDGNNVSGTDGNGIKIRGAEAQGTMNVRISNNTVAAPVATALREGIFVEAGGSTAGTDNDVCLDIFGNTTAGASDGFGDTAPGIRLRKQGTSTTVNAFSIEGMAATSSPGVEQYVGNGAGKNPGSANGTFGTNGVVLGSATSGFSNCSAAPLRYIPKGFSQANEPLQNNNADSPTSFLDSQDTFAAIFGRLHRATQSLQVVPTPDVASLPSLTVVAGISGDRNSSNNTGWPSQQLGSVINSGAHTLPNGWATAQSAGVRGLTDNSSRKDIRLNHAAKRRATKANDVATTDNAAAQNPANTVAMQPVAAPLFPAGTFPVNGTGTGFSLPPGKTTTITFKVQVNNPPNFSSPTTNKVSHQGTLTGTFQNHPLLTDDPDVGGATDPTETTIDLFDTTNTLTPASAPLASGQSITFTATIAFDGTTTPIPTAGTVPTGTVDFFDNGSGTPITGCAAVAVTGPNNNRTATCTTSFTTGAHSVVAQYNGDGNFEAETSNASVQTVAMTDTDVAVTSSQNPSSTLQAVTFTATVTSSGTFTGPPTGTVTFKSNGTDLVCTGPNPATLVNGVATCQTVFAVASTPPTHNVITAVYGGDTNFNGDTGTLSPNQEVVACQPNPVVTTNLDSGLGSLRQALLDVCHNGTITFNIPPPGADIITLTTGELTINPSATTVTITGPGASLLTVQRDDSLPTKFRIFNIGATQTVNISGMTITKGRAPDGAVGILGAPGANGNNGGATAQAAAGQNGVQGASGDPGVVGGSGGNGFDGQSGGGILNNGILTLTGVVLSNNFAGDGGQGGQGGVGGTGGMGGQGQQGGPPVNPTDANTNGGKGGTGGQAGQGGPGGPGGRGGLGGGVYNAAGATLNLIETTLNANQTGVGGAGGPGGAAGTQGLGGLPGLAGIGGSGGAGSPGATGDAGATNTAGGSGAGGNGGGGGGVYSLGILTILRSTLSANKGMGLLGAGGGIDSEGGTLTITNSTISGNTAFGSGGGVLNGTTSGATLTGVTITGNRADNDGNLTGDGGGIKQSSSNPLTLRSTIVAGNFKGTGLVSDDITGTIDPASSFNLIGDAATSGGLIDVSAPNPNNNQVGNAGSGTVAIATVLDTTLADNSGTTKTHALVDNSPAIDKGDDFSVAATTDQRGFPRPVNFPPLAPAGPGDESDIGAFERQVTPDAPGTPDLQAGSDTPTASAPGNTDNVTSATTLIFDISGVTIGATVKLFRDTVPATAPVEVASGVASGTSISLTDPGPVAQGQYTYTAKQTLGGLTSDSSGGLLVTVDTTPPAEPTTPDLQSASDTFAGSGTNSDNRTSAASRTFDVGNAEQGALVELLRNGTVVASFVATDPTPSIVALTDNSTPVDGTYNYSSRQTDPAGNTDSSGVSLAVVLDFTAPTVSSVTRADGNPTNAQSVNFTVTFSENVSGVNTADFVTVNSGGLSGSSVTGVTGSNNLYTVTVDTGTGDGTVRLDVLDDDTIRDLVNLPLNGGFNAGQAYTISKSDPFVVSINRLDPDPTNASTVQFAVTFNKSVTGVNITGPNSDFTLVDGTNSITGEAITVLSGSGANYTVTINTGTTGDGTLGLNLVDNDSIIDAGNRPLGPGDGSFTGQIYTVDKSAPTVTSFLKASDQADPATGPTATTSIRFVAVFSEPVTGLTASDIEITGTSGASLATISEVAPDYPGNAQPLDGKTYLVSISGMTQSGNVTAQVKDLAVQDAAGNNSTPASAMATVVFNADNFTSFEVNTTEDSTDGVCTPLGALGEDCTLREAILAANADFGAETITFNIPPADLGCPGGVCTISLLTVLPDLSSSMTIQGTGANVLKVVRDGAATNFRIFAIPSGSHDVTIDGLTISNGNNSAGGGGISVNGSGTVNLSNSTISGNSGVASNGGGVFKSGTGTLNITNSTISGNSSGNGAGVYASQGAVKIRNTTISGNAASNSSAGIGNNGSNMAITHSTITENRADSDNSGAGAAGGISSGPGTLILRNTIVARNLNGNEQQVETATVLGAITADGNAKVEVTAIGMGNTPKTILVPVLNGDSASVVAGKMRTALTADPDVSGFFTVSGAGANIVLTASTARANDTTLNIATDNATSAGLTPAPTSTNTTAGAVADDIQAASIDASSSFNLIGVSNVLTNGVNDNQVGVADPGLFPLANNGGPTLTHALQCVSVAIDKGTGTLTTLAAAIDDTQTSITVTSGLSVQVGLTIVIDSEQMEVTAQVGNTLTVTRGANASTAAAHASLAGVYPATSTDQRGGARPLDLADGVYPNASGAGADGSDIGAFEVQTGGGCLPLAVPPAVDPTVTNEDTLVVITLTGTYSQNTPLTFTITDQPDNGSALTPSAANCTFTTFQTCTSTVNYTPNADYHGPDAFKFRVSAGGLNSDEADVNITVVEVNDRPIANNDTLSDVIMNSGQRIIPWSDLTGNDSPGPADESGQTLVVSSVSNPTGGTVTNDPANSRVLFTPTNNFFGPAGFRYFVQDSGAAPNTSATFGVVGFTIISPPLIQKNFSDTTVDMNVETVALTFKVTNPNNGTTLNGIGFIDNLPGGLEVATPSGLSGTCGGGTITAADGSTQISLSGATLGANVFCTFSVNIRGTSIGLKTNVTGAVTSTEGGSGGTATASVTVLAPDMTITKTHSGSFDQGQTETYTITVTNSGNADTTAAVTMTDVLPVGLTPTGPNGVVNGWTCNINGQTVTCTRGDVLTPGNSYPAISLTVDVANPAPLTVTNTATVAGGGEQTTNNNSASDMTSINCQTDFSLNNTNPLMISRFRMNGPAGPQDEFVEIYNPSTTAHTVASGNCSGGGYGVFASSGNGTSSNTASLVCYLPNGTVIPAGGYYLCTGVTYSLGNLGRNGGPEGATSTSDAPIGCGGLCANNIPDDAGLGLLNVASGITLTPTGFSGAVGDGGLFIYDKVGFGPYGAGAPAPAYPSLSANYCEGGGCLQPVGDASTSSTCANLTGLYPVVPEPPACYGLAGQYEFLRRQTGFDATLGTVHVDTNNSVNDWILVAPNSTTNMGLQVTGVSGVTAVHGAAGPQNSSAPSDFPKVVLPQAPFDEAVPQLVPPNAERNFGLDPTVANPANAPMGTFALRLRFTNNSAGSIAGLRFRVDNLTTLCGPQSATPTVGTGVAKNLSATAPNCGTGSFTAILKLLNSAQEVVVDSTSTAQAVTGTVMEDLSASATPTPPGAGALSPNGGGLDNSIIVNPSFDAASVGDGVTGGSGVFVTSISTADPTNVIRIRVKFGVVKSGRFVLLITPAAKTAP